VHQGDEVAVGTAIGDFLFGTRGYPPLHYMVTRNGSAVCAYEESASAARLIFDGIAAMPGNNMPQGTICGN
jgi:hypothetical protein